MNSLASIEHLLQEHLEATFPQDCVGVEVDGVDLVLLDADTAGCISVFLKRNASLDLGRTAVLGICYRHLALVTQNLHSDARDYYRRLETIAGLVLEAVAKQEKAG